MEVEALLDRLRRHGVAVTINGERLRLEPRSRVPGHLVVLLRENKADVHQYLIEHPPSDKLGASQTERCPPLESWRKDSIPEWRLALDQSVEDRDHIREE